MKLLKKSVLTNELASERKKQIDEGVALASRIDGLRRTMAEVEEQHRKFMQAMKAEIEKETRPLHAEVASLKAEVLDLEEKRSLLMIPLNKEWDKLESAKKEHEVKMIALDKELLSTVKINEKNIILGKKLKDKLLIVKIQERELLRAHSKTEEINKDIEEIRKSLSIEKNEFEDLVEKNKRSLLSEYALIEVKNRELEIANDKIEREKEDIINKRILLEDREKTLEREIKRNG